MTDAQITTDLRRILCQTWGFDDFRADQARAACAFAAGRDAVLLLPTGGGKSVCYQAPAIWRAEQGLGPTLVISPLVALMDDQVAALRARGVRAVALHAGLDADAAKLARHDARDAQLVYCSPERLAKTRFMAFVRALGVSALAVDEAHCIAEWGHDFRPDYLTIGELRCSLGVPTLATTATATPRALAQIVAALGLRDPEIVRGSFTRDDLSLLVEHHRGDLARAARTAELLDAHALGRGGHGRAIVYAATRKRTSSLADSLKKLGFRAGFYHAGRTDGARVKAHADFASGKLQVLVATTAYGMGIDLPDVRLVVHVQAPGTLEAYVQQAGRAGRDGLGATAALLYAPGDALTHARLRQRGKSAPTPGADEGWRALQDYAFGARCRMAAIAAWFGETAAACGRCDACTAGAQVLAQVQDARAQGRERRQAKQQAEAAADAIALTDAQLQQVVDFVGGLAKPVGARLVALGLRGSKAKDVLRRKLDANPLHGALEGLPERTLIAAIHGLLDEGRLAKKGVKYPTVWLPAKPVRPISDGPRTARRGASRDPAEAALKAFRKREARRRRWKAFQIFTDETMRALIEARPGTSAELEAVRGMGPKKVERFGSALLQAIRDLPDRL